MSEDSSKKPANIPSKSASGFQLPGKDLALSATTTLTWLTGNDPDSAETFGSLRSEGRYVKASDGTMLWIEIDEPPASDQTATSSVPTVIFCHGYAINSDSWHFQRRDLRDRIRMVFWDHRSHGRSQRSPKENCTIEQLALDLRTVIDTVGPTGPIVLVGHSMGGMTIIAAAAIYPELFGTSVKGAMLVNSSAGGFSTVTFGLPKPVSDIAHKYANEVGAALARQAQWLQLLRTQTALSAEFTKLTQLGPAASMSVAGFVDRMMAQTPIDVMAEFLPLFESYDQHSGLEALKNCHVSVVVGDHDPVLPTSHSENIVERVPGAELFIVPGVGHVSMLENHDYVTTRLARLLLQVQSSAA